MWSFLVGSVVTLIVGDGALSQVLGYETTSFSCQGRSPGYYADLETGCKTYHVCDGSGHFTYVCPARTLFQQRSRICDHAYLVRCGGDEIHLQDEDGISRRLEDPEDGDYFTEDIENISTQTEEFFTTDTPELVEISTASTISATTEQPTTIVVQKFPSESHRQNATSVEYSSQTNKILKFAIKDIRSLFYIPEIDNNSVTIQAEREFLLPVDRKHLLRFRNWERVRHTFSACPSYCDQKFFLPGTCHPCIMIK